MKIAKYKVVDAGATVATSTLHYVKGKLVGDFSASTDVRFEEGIQVVDIIDYIESAAVLADVAFTQDITFATAPAEGDEFMVTVSYEASGSRIHRRFGYIAQAGSLTVTAIASAIKDKINASDVPFAASNASGVLTITGAAGVGYQPILGGGTDSSATTVTLGAVTDDAEKTDAAYYAAKFENVDTDDFGDDAVGYAVHVIVYLESVSTVHGIVKEKKYAAFFTENTVNYGHLTTAFESSSYKQSKYDLL
jgi:hypothetical protein